MAINKDAEKLIDKYINELPVQTKEICTKLRELVHMADSRIVEDWKWGPNFNKDGLLCNIGAFKGGYAVMHFFKGALMKDPKKVFLSTDNKAGRRINFYKLSDIDEKTIISYVKEAVRVNEQGLKVKKTAIKVVIPKELKEAFKNNSKAYKFFQTLSPSYQRDYTELISTAKQEATRKARIEKAIKLLSEGKKLNEKYMK